jgi:hypothetical protein
LPGTTYCNSTASRRAVTQSSWAKVVPYRPSLSPLQDRKCPFLTTSYLWSPVSRRLQATKRRLFTASRILQGNENKWKYCYGTACALGVLACRNARRSFRPPFLKGHLCGGTSLRAPKRNLWVHVGILKAA